MSVLAPQLETLRQLQPKEISGTIASMRGMTMLVNDLPLPIGALVRIPAPTVRRDDTFGEVVGFDRGQSVVMLLGHASGIGPGLRVIGEQAMQTVTVGRSLLGRIMDGLGRPLDGRPPILDGVVRPLHPPAPKALRRSRITEPLPTGVRAIDGFLTIGCGQRIGIFSAAGVGKSTLLANIARHSSADVNVIALVGERGREVREFIEHALGPQGLARSVLVVATGDESPLLRVRAALVATTVAEFFRESGDHVTLLMDSLTRFAQALRQIGLAVGEQPATRGYTPSVFAAIPSLVERAGGIEGGGSITGFYAVLVEGDDLNEPVSDTARGVLDGHIVLSRRLASMNHYPAIDVLESISRVADQVCDVHHVRARQRLTRTMAAHCEAEELISIGAYARGSDPDVDVAIELRPRLEAFLRQPDGAGTEYPAICRRMIELEGLAEQAATRLGKNPAAQAHPAQATVGSPSISPDGAEQ